MKDNKSGVIRIEDAIDYVQEIQNNAKDLREIAMTVFILAILDNVSKKESTAPTDISDDLISRKAAIEEIESLSVTVTGLRAGKGVLNEFAKAYKEAVLRTLDESKTAYDVDKVVEQIREKLFYKCEWKQQCTDEVIKIVKAGRV